MKTLLVLAGLAAGCGGAVELPEPDGFVVLDESRQSPFAERATTAGGVVIGVRELDNDPHGPLAFWVDAVKERLRRAGGYALVGEEEVRAASGQVGRRLRFGRDQGARGYSYWVTLFVAGDRLVVVEAGGPTDAFEAARDDLAAAIDGVRLL